MMISAPVCRLLFTLITSLLCGCVATTKVASPDSIQRLRQVQIIPIESHSLNIEDQTALAGSTVAGLGLIPRSNFSNQRGLLVVGTLMMLAEVSSSERREQQAVASAQVEEILKQKTMWSPNVEVAA